MASPAFENIKQRVLAFWSNLVKKSNEEEIANVGRERIIVFVVAFILAICLWFMVNLSQKFTLNIDLPIEKGAIPDDKALTEALPKTANVSVSGEGWQLISIYNNPPSVNVDVMNPEINLYEQVQRQVNALYDVKTDKVQPLMLTLDLESRHSKRVPVRPVLDVTFEGQYGFIGKPNLQPDSVTISGAASLLRNITEWPTDSLSLKTVSTDISRSVQLKESELITLSQDKVQFNGEVAQFTEGETNVTLTTRNLPIEQSISFSPSSITIKYDVPIDEYANVQDRQLFRAYFTYQQIREDSTGYIRPNIEQISNNKHIKVRSFQPEEVAYFMVVGN